MSQYDPNKIEEYQLLLLRNPRSPVFAALTEAYRKMGLLDEALEVSQKGVKHNPEFVSGLVAHAKVLVDLKDYNSALQALHKAHLLKPENLLALKLLGHCQAQLKKYTLALKSFKKLLILSPQDETAKKFVERWEFLENVPSQGQPLSLDLGDIESWLKTLPDGSQVTHLIDSFAHSGEKRTALDIVNAARLLWPDRDELKKRQNLLYETLNENPITPPPFDELQFKKRFYKQLLQRIGSQT